MKKVNIYCRVTARSAGFTLVEVMIVVAIIALISAIAIPGLQHARLQSHRVALVKELKNTAEGFEMYAADNLKLPLETNNTGLAISQIYTPPTGMQLYLPQNSTWTNGTNGTWYWLYWPTALPPYKGFIYLINPNLTNDDITYVDQQLDDGNPNTGSIINYGNGQLLYALQ